MAADTFTVDDLNEFFDFDQLVQDHAIHAENEVSRRQDHYLVEDVSIMDWAVDEPTMTMATKASLSHDTSMLDMIKNDSVACNPPLMSFDHSQQSTGVSGTTFLYGQQQTNESLAFSGYDAATSGAPYLSDLTCEQLDSVQESTDASHYLQEAHSRKSNKSTITPQSKKAPSASSNQSSAPAWKPASAKRKGPQSRIPLEARQILEDEFAANPYPCSWELDIIAHQANLDVKKVRNWFNNTRARKKGEGKSMSKILGSSPLIRVDYGYQAKDTCDGIGRSLEKRLSKSSLEALEKHNENVPPPQPPLAVYLAQSYKEEAVSLSAVQAAVENSSLSEISDFTDEWSLPQRGRRSSVITSVASSEGTAPTTYTISSSGSRSNISSFGRDRRRGRRRMAWKVSPHNNRQKINGLNSAGEPQKDLPFFCTFCPRAFKTKYEWVRHEDSVHALRTTWICCDSKSLSFGSCPFCGHANPDETHLAGHKYQQCWSKPESQRTFYRRDHFVQHLHHVHFANAKHPSVRVGCQARLMATEGQNFGCKELAMKWRRFGAPMKPDDPMLHCGFCGKRSRDWSERCEHIAEHLIARELDRAVWWPERKENHLGNLYSASPFESFRCRYCLRIFRDIKEMNEHSHCKVWSCRFLKSFDDVVADNAGPPLYPDFPNTMAHQCHLCGVNYRTLHAEHAENYHRYRSCNQEFYTSEESFLQHLHNFHGASQLALLQGSSIIEQNFMRNKGASFEPVEFNESWQPCHMDLDPVPIGALAMKKASLTRPINEKKDSCFGKKQSPPPWKKHREDTLLPAATKTQQWQRTNSTLPKAETQSPRFLRLSSRIFYSHNAFSSSVPRDNQDVIEELPKPHVASLVMSAGLVSMAISRWAIKPKKHLASNMVELVLEDAS